jgi:hypothetical protein
LREQIELERGEKQPNLFSPDLLKKSDFGERILFI